MNAAPPGWNPDPTGRHEYRYWNGTAWTDDVSDGGVTATDPVGGAAPAGGEPAAPFDATTAAGPTTPSEPTAPYGPAQQPGGFGTPPGQTPGYGTPGGQTPGYGTPPDQGYSGFGAPPGPPGAPDPYGGAPLPPTGPARSGPPVGLLLGLGAVAVIVVIVLVVMLTGGDDDGETATDETATTAAGRQDADVFTLGVGDCMLDETPDGQVQSVPVVPCEEPHASEIFYSHIMDAGELPSPDGMEDIATDECLREFETFVGVPYEQSVLLVTWLEPTRESWDAGDRELLCIAVDPAGDATGSFAGTAR